MVLSTIPFPAKIGLILTFLPIAAFIAQPFVIRARLAIKRSRGTITHWRDRVQLRYRSASTDVWMFAWWKLRTDPMFRDLPGILKTVPTPKVALDLGCGYGFAASTLLEWCPGLTIYGIDPDPARAPVATVAFDSRGKAVCAGAPDFEVAGLPDTFDTIVCLDMIHFLSEADLQTTFNRLFARLEPGGYFLLRSLLPPIGVGSFLWNLQVVSRKITGGVVHHRPKEKIEAQLAAAGFVLVESKHSSANGELHWFIAQRGV